MQIVSRDSIFARALQISLRRAGFDEVRTSTALPELPHSPLIVDLDDFDLPSSSAVITFSSRPDRHADLTRPFLTGELVALCSARFLGEQSSATLPSPLPLSSDQPFLLLTEGGVLLDGRTVSLSPTEHALLELLLAHAGECVSKQEIDRLWGETHKGNMTEVYIRYLRQKLDEPSGLRLIRTVRGKGYILCLPNTTR